MDQRFVYCLGLNLRIRAAEQKHKAAQTAYKITTGTGRFNVKGRCPDVSLFTLSLILRNPAALLLISGKTLRTGSALPLCPLY